MEKIRFGLLTFAMMVSTAAFVSCSDDEDTAQGTQPTTADLQGEYTSDLVLEANQSYTLSGGVHIKSGARLVIPEGVTITAVDDDTPDYILIEQGARIEANGTATNPIVMTSQLKEAGAWGGIHICGRAHTNAEGGIGRSEIGNATYGGNDDNDNSGTLRYVRLEYTGFALDEEHEANGISFYGVGNGTTVEYCQAYKGSDDGFEFFGGSVNVRNMVATSCSDDSFDWTEGWNGKAQFLVAYQENESTLGYDCDCLMECDNNGDNNQATPVAHPVIANVTLIGNDGDAQGVRLREGTEVELYNAIITGKALPLTVESAGTENALADGTSVLEYVALGGVLNSNENIYTNDMFAAAAGNLTDQTFSFTNDYVGTVDGGKDLSADSFFTQTDYKGAVSASNDWTDGWTL
ncbi:MAG TPA: hypothetical protein IAA93_05985 [Candidatus Avibacteroides avistercoris]|uniref:Right-handed parallel beta-helix repeat-containing protein n=1 Tax=Candidatus Avibacteroides avistercoris TaxID=2840690 RepID=A0A9D2ZV72_9BACT|nr:hypothetical protein [Candidatus Avibacteroides avistercoris]